MLEQGLTLQVCELDRPSPQRKNKKVVRLKKDESDKQIMKILVGTRAIDKDTKAKGIKTGVIKRKLKFQDYKNCLVAAQI